jgi:orotate phosphoribosyltransferase
MHFIQEEFNEFMIEHGVIGFFEKPVALKSKRKSHYYVNWRDVTNNAYLLDKLTDYILGFVNELGLEVDCFVGVPEGATKTAIITQYKFAKSQQDFDTKRYSLSMIRGKPKSHGLPKDRFFIGVPEGKTILIEDVTTTGSSLLSTIYNLKEAGVELVGAIG